jgi:beta-lactam-binding protein with PASTA domain
LPYTTLFRSLRDVLRREGVLDPDRAMELAGFTNVTSLQTEAPGGEDPGTVVGSDPQPGTQANKGDQITLLVVGPA